MARIPSGMRKKENGLFEKRFTVEGKRYSAYGRSTKECAENELRIREEIKAGLQILLERYAYSEIGGTFILI